MVRFGCNDITMHLTLLCMICLSTFMAGEADEDDIEFTWDSQRKIFVYDNSDKEVGELCKDGRLYPSGIRVLEPMGDCFNTWIQLEEEVLLNFKDACITDGHLECSPFPPSFRPRCINYDVSRLKMSYLCEMSRRLEVLDDSEPSYLCPSDKQIWLTDVIILCQRDTRDYYFVNGTTLQAFKDACNGNSKCDFQSLLPLPLSGCQNNNEGNGILLRYFCQNVAADGETTFDMASNIRGKHVDQSQVGLSMKSRGKRECRISAENLHLQMLYIDIGQQFPCQGWVSIAGQSWTSAWNISCERPGHAIREVSNPEFLLQNTRSHAESEFIVQVSVSSGFVLMQFSAKSSRIRINCGPMSNQKNSPTVAANRILAATAWPMAAITTTPSAGDMPEVVGIGGKKDEQSSGIDIQLLIVVISVVAAVTLAIAITLCVCFFSSWNSPLQRWASRRRRGRRPQQEGNQPDALYSKCHEEYASVDEGQIAHKGSPLHSLVPEFQAPTTTKVQSSADFEDYMEIPCDTPPTAQHKPLTPPCVLSPSSPRLPALHSRQRSPSLKPAVPQKPLSPTSPGRHRAKPTNTILTQPPIVRSTSETQRDRPSLKPTTLPRSSRANVNAGRAPELDDAHYSQVNKITHTSTSQEGLYNVAGQSKPSFATCGATYHTMFSVEGEYSHLVRPGEEPGVIDNVYDG